MGNAYFQGPVVVSFREGILRQTFQDAVSAPAPWIQPFPARTGSVGPWPSEVVLVVFVVFFSTEKKDIYIYICLYTVKIYIHNKYICINKYIHKIYNVFIYIYVISHIIYRRMCSDINHLDINPIDML